MLDLIYLGQMFNTYSELIFKHLKQLMDDDTVFEIHTRYLKLDEDFKINVRIMEIDEEFFDLDLYSEYHDERFLLRLDEFLKAILED